MAAQTKTVKLDRQRRVTSLLKNNAALDLKHSAAEVWLVGPDTADLVKKNVAFSEVNCATSIVAFSRSFKRSSCWAIDDQVFQRDANGSASIRLSGAADAADGRWHSTLVERNLIPAVVELRRSQ